MANAIELEYHIPSVGSARVGLRDESAQLYRFLVEVGEVERLKSLDHLGLVRAVWDGAHHPRWEYVASILNLIEHCRDVPEVRLASPVVLPGSGVEVSSGYELMRAWVLLLNVGHLVWTFASERALLLELPLRSRARSEFLSLLDTSPIRAWADGVLREAGVYQFFQALSLVRLRQLSAAAPPAELTAWEEMLSLYVSLGNVTPRILYLRRIYRNLRRIAYLALDTHYTPAVVNVNLPQLLTDPTALASAALRTATGEADELRALEAQLTQEIYLSEAVLRAVAAREHSLRNWIRRSLRKAGVGATIQDLADGRFRDDVDVEEIETVVRLPAWVSPPFDQFLLSEVNVRNEQRASDRDLSVRNPRSRVLWWAAPYSRQWILQTFAPDALDSQQASFDFAFNEIARIHDRASRMNSKLLTESIRQRALFGRLAVQLVEAALRLVFDRDIRWEWEPIPTVDVAWFTTRREAERLLSATEGRATADRGDELRATQASLPGAPGAYLALNAVRLTAFDANGTTMVAELDGVIVASDNVGEMSVTLVEAKRQRSGARGAARRQQNRLLRALRPRAGVERRPDADAQVGSLGYAASTLAVQAWQPVAKSG